MINFLTVTAKLGAVLVSIAAALFWFVHKGWFQMEIFSRMNAEQTFDAFIWSISIAALLVVVAIVGHVASKRTNGKNISAGDKSVALDNSGKNNSVKIRN